MRPRVKAYLSALGLILAAAVLAVVLVWVLTESRRFTKADHRGQVDYIQDEIKNLRKLLQEETDRFRQEGKTEAEIEAVRAKFQAEFDRLQGEIDKLTKDKTQGDNP
jgi:hypothetical protein